MTLAQPAATSHERADAPSRRGSAVSSELDSGVDSRVLLAKFVSGLGLFSRSAIEYSGYEGPVEDMLKVVKAESREINSGKESGMGTEVWVL